MENFDEKIVQLQDSGSHKKIFVAILIAGIFVLVLGGIIWYNVGVLRNASEEVVPLDSDRDLLSDDEEVRIGTDPQKEDTDGDGLTDSVEVRMKTDPKNAQSISAGKLDLDVIAEKQRAQEQLEREERLSKLKQN
jgi:hypothetical protein